MQKEKEARLRKSTLELLGAHYELPDIELVDAEGPRAEERESRDRERTRRPAETRDLVGRRRRLLAEVV